MSSDEFELLTRESVLEGLFGGHEKRASTLLVAIESRTAHLVAQSKQAMERFLTEEAAEERELAFLEALALGREPPLRPTIQDLQRYAPQWASLVPENPKAQAAVAHLLGQKYDFTYQAVPGIRVALGLDEEAVQQAYQRLYHQPLETIFAPRAALADRLRWAWAGLAGWLESLPPFWTAFALTLTETVGAGILALPIAVAGVGPLVGVVLLLVLGLVNVLTIAALVEAFTRNGNVRYGQAYFGRLVADYLGSAGSLILTLALIILNIGSLLASYIGLATTLSDATPVPAQVWAGLLFLVGLYFLRRKSLDATVAAALLVGAMNIGVILILSLLTLTKLRLSNLRYVNVPFVGGQPFEPSVLALIFGVTLLAYFGHTSAGNCARIVLRRDPSGRALVWGSTAAVAASIGLYCLWVIAVNGAIAPATLSAETGTVLTPLAARVGPIVYLLGSIFVVFALGMGSIHFSLGFFNQVREWLPTQRRPVVMLPRRRGRLLLCSNRRGVDSANGSLRLGLTYLGLEASSTRPERSPRFRLDVQVNGATHYLEMAVTDSWEVTALFDRLPVLRRHSVRLALAILDASQEHVRLRVSSPLHLTYEGEWYAAGLSMADVLDLPDPQQQILTWMTREGVTGQETVSLADVVAHIGQSEAVARTMLNTLVEQGFIQELKMEGEARYQPRLVSKRGRQLPEDIWQALGEKEKTPARGGPETGFPQGSGKALLGERGRFFLSVAPVVAVFLLTEWLLLIRGESFAGPLGFTGTIAATLVSGIFPVLMLVASRRKGDFVPSVVLPFLAHPFFITILYLLFLASLFLHGLVIWQSPVERAVALAVGLLMLGATIVMMRRGAFDSRLVVELREDQRERGRAVFKITAGGQPVTAEVRLGYADGEQRVRTATAEIPTFSALHYATFQLPATDARELKVWAHQITSEGNSEGLPARLKVHCSHEKKEFDLKLSSGQIVLPLDGGACRLRIALPESSGT